jgi:hypothetical protein
MKSLIRILFAWIGLAVCCAAYSATNNMELTKGGARIVLLTVSKSNIYAAETKTTNAAPVGISIAYVSEVLSKQPGGFANVMRMKFFVDGKQVEIPKKAWDETGITIHEYKKYNWKKLPKPQVTNPDAVRVIDAWIPGFELPKGKVDVQIFTRNGTNTTTFAFQDVRLE